MESHLSINRTIRFYGVDCSSAGDYPDFEYIGKTLNSKVLNGSKRLRINYFYNNENEMILVL